MQCLKGLGEGMSEGRLVFSGVANLPVENAVKVISCVYHTDPGHGWLAVKGSLLAELGIEREITSFSFMRGETVYLEEDGDMSAFLDACHAKGYRVEFRDSYRDTSPVRNYPPYEEHWLGKPLAEKDMISLHGHQENYKVTERTAKGYIIVGELSGVRYKLPLKDYPKYVEKRLGDNGKE